MNIFEVQKLLAKGVRIQEIPMKVTFYARVSSEKDEQLNSLDNQISYYKDLIKNNPNWTYVEGYIDEGLSGKSTKKRDSFNRMISDGRKGLFDFIVTKEISRFARNTVDSLKYTRELLSCGVGVLFENNALNTFDQNSEFVLSLLSSVAQNELRVLSDRVKFGHAQAIAKGVVLGNSRIFGYDKMKKRLVINEKEATMVTEIFELYASGDYSLKQIEIILWNKGYRNRNGNKIAHNTLSSIISNPKYKGYYVGGKVKNLDLFSEKREFLPPEEWTMYKDESGEIVPPIVSEELWETANKVLAKRSADVKYRQGICNHPNLLTGKIVCKNCGSPYYRKDCKNRDGSKNSKWVCSGKINNGKNYCDSFAIYESEIKKILYETLRCTREDIGKIIEEYAQMLWDIMKDDSLETELERAETQRKKFYEKEEKLFSLYADGKCSETEYIRLKKGVSNEIESIEKTVEELKQQLVSDEGLRKSIDEIKSTLMEASKVSSEELITKKFVDKYIDKIFVTAKDGCCAKIEIKLVTGETTEKYLFKTKGARGAKTVDSAGLSGSEERKSRVGMMSKKMIQSYEQNMK